MIDMESVLSRKKKIYTNKELKDLGYSNYQIRQLVGQKVLIKLNRFNYENMEYEGEDSDYIYVYAYVPDGVICLLSAASYYHLTTFRPESIDVAVHRKRNVTSLPDWPSLKLWYFAHNRLEDGVIEIDVCHQKVKIFDIEKTVIDIIYYRETIGVEYTKEILMNYLNRRDRDIQKLYTYAQNLRCHHILRTYLEVLL